MDPAPSGDGWNDKMMDMQSVAFDPSEATDDEHGREKYVAYVGIRKDGKDNYVAYAWVENIKNKLKSNLLVLGRTWGDEDDRLFSEYYASNNYLCLTAGDYNGDKKDTIIVYAPLYRSSYDLKLLELSLDVNSMTLSITHSGDDLLHKQYRSSNLKIYDEESHLGVDLATGDVNRDGIDDLAVTSYFANADERGKGESTDLFIPRISVARGADKADYNILAANDNNTSVAQIKDDAGKVGAKQLYDTALFPAVAMADIDADGYDEIVTAGYKTQILTKDNNAESIDNARYNISNTKINTEVFTFKDDNGLKTMASGTSAIYAVDTNGWTQYETSTSDYTMSKPVMAGYYPNGKVKGESVFISGTVYDFTGYLPKASYTPAYYTTGDKGAGGAIISRAGLIQVQAGNFTGNTVGREQIVYSVALRQQTFHDYHCFAGIISAEYEDVIENGKVVKYGDIKNYTNANTNTDSEAYYVNGYNNTEDHPTNLLVTSIDCDDDGMLARFKSKVSLMSDVNVAAVLQAHPYFDDFETTDGETEYKITETNIESSSNGVDYELSLGVTYSEEISAGAKASMDVEAGVKLNLSGEWEDEYRYSTSTAFAASDKDEVVVLRRPLYSYTFAVYDADVNKWSDDPTYNKGSNNGNDFGITINGQPEYTMLELSEYNDFVTEYNALADTQTEKLKQYFKDCGDENREICIAKLEAISDAHLGNEGNPYGYYARGEGSDAGLKEFDGLVDLFDEGNNSGTITRYMANSSSSTHKFNFSIGVEAGFSAAGGVNVLVGECMVGGYARGSLSYTHSSVTGHEEETEVGCGMKGFGGDEISEKTGMSKEIFDQFGFSWAPCTWEFYPEGKGDENNKKPVVPVIGYVLNRDAGALNAPPKTVTGLSAVEVTDDGEDAVKLTWTNPVYRESEQTHRMGAQNYRIYAKNADNIHAGGYTLILTTNDSTLLTEYTIKKSKVVEELANAGITPPTDGKFTFVVSTTAGGGGSETFESVWSNDATVKLDENKAVYYSKSGNGSIVVRDNDKTIANGGYVKLGGTYTVDLAAADKYYLSKLVIEQNGQPVEKTYSDYKQNVHENFTVTAGPVNITATYIKFKKFDLDITGSSGGKVRVTDITDNNKEVYTGSTCNLQDVIREGHTVKIEAVADDYFGLMNLTVNGNDYTAPGYCTFTAVSDIDVSVSFERGQCHAIVSALHGSLEVIAFDEVDSDDLHKVFGCLQTQNITLMKGQKFEILNSPEPGYLFTALYINGSRVDKNAVITADDSIISGGKITIKGDFKLPTIKLDKSSYEYTGKPISPAMSVIVGDKILKKDTDYTVIYKNNTNIGTAEYVINAIGDYSGRINGSFAITKASQTVTATAKADKISVGKTTQITAKGIGTLSYQSNNTGIATVSSKGLIMAKKVGTVKITVSAAGNTYYKSAKKTITIRVIPAATASVSAANVSAGVKLTWKKVAGAEGYYVYKADKKIAKIVGNSKVTYTDTKANSNGSKYSYKIYAYASTGTGPASKSAVSYYVSKPSAPSLASSSAAKVKVTWKKNDKASGYQLMYAYDKDFKKSPKTVTIKDKKTLTKTIGNLTKKKTLYVKIRCYKTVSDKKYYSSWSSAKSIVVK